MLFNSNKPYKCIKENSHRNHKTKFNCGKFINNKTNKLTNRLIYKHLAQIMQGIISNLIISNNIEGSSYSSVVGSKHR